MLLFRETYNDINNPQQRDRFPLLPTERKFMFQAIYAAVFVLIPTFLILVFIVWYRSKSSDSRTHEQRSNKKPAAHTQSHRTSSAEVTPAMMYRASAIVFHRFMEIHEALDRLNPESRDRLKARFYPELSSYFSIEQTAEWTDAERFEEFLMAHKLLDVIEKRIEIEWECLREENRLEVLGMFEAAENLRQSRSIH